jgi:transposase
MEYYVGLDVSLKQTSICVVDQSGSVVREGVVDSDPEAISVYVRSKAPGAVRRPRDWTDVYLVMD